MAEPIRVDAPVGDDDDKIMSFETGKLAGLAGGAVMAGLGNTRILVTATGAKHVREGIDFFPLTVDIEERMYAAGKIPGSFFRREGRAPESAILTCRLIDRPLRPSFPEGFRNEVHIVGTVVRRRPAQPLRRAGHQRRLRRADALRHPLRGPHRRRAHGVHHRRRVDPASHLRGGRRRHLRDRRGRPRARQRRRRRHDGRGRRHREVLRVLRGRRPQGRRGRAGHRPGGVASAGSRTPSPCSSQLVDAVGSNADHVLRRRRPTTPTSHLRRGQGPRWRADVGEIMQIADKTDRSRRRGRPACRAAGADRPRPGRPLRSPTAPARTPRWPWPPSRSRTPFRSLSKTTVRTRIVNEGARIDGRGLRDLRPLSAEVGRHPDRPRHRPVPAWRDPGAERRHPGHGQDGPDDRRHRPDHQEAVPAPLQLPAVLHR